MTNLQKLKMMRGKSGAVFGNQRRLAELRESKKNLAEQAARA